MSDLSEIESIKAEVVKLNARIDALKSSAFTVEVPALKFEVLPGEAEGVSWDEAVAWAKEQGGELPTRQEALALFANLKSEFSENWYWTGEQHADDSGFAWVQDFNGGTQDYGHKSIKYRARAVRRLSL
jgi:hypothetical protein